MLQAAIFFFILALIAIFLGTNKVAGVSPELGKLLLLVFLALGMLSLIVSLITGRRSGPPR